MDSFKYFEDMYPNEYLEENNYLHRRSRIDDVVGDVRNTSHMLSQAIEVMLRPELRKRLEAIYTKNFIEEMENFVKFTRDF